MDQNEDEGRASGENHGKQGDEETVARLEEMKKSVEAKMALRQSNSNPERPDSGSLRALDSSIKRNTAVIKKLKQINDEQREGLLDELKNVNLSKFVSEAVTSICDAKLRTSDIQAAVQICSLLHQRYKDFSPSLIQGLLKVFFSGKLGDDSDIDKNLKAMKKRSALKLLLELFFVGVVEDGGIFVNIIKELTSAEHLKDRETTQTNLTLLASFARQGRVLVGLPLAPGQEIYEEFYKGLNITADQKKFLKKALHAYFEAASELLRSEHMSLRQLEHENAKTLNAKGELSDDNSTSYEKLRKSYDLLYRNVSSFAEALDMQPPVMPEDSHTTRVTSGEDASSSTTGKDPSAAEPIWDDEDTKSFYECLPDLRAFVPAVLLGDAESKSNEQSTKALEQLTEPATESDQGQQSTEDSVLVSAEPSTVQSTEKANEKEEKEKSKDPEKEKGKEKEKSKDLGKEKGKEKEKEADRKVDNEKEKLKTVEGTNLEALLQRLPGSVSRDLIDQLTVEFCYLNSKASRKRLVRALFNVPRTSLELLPYYSRMVATLSTCVKDVSTMLLQSLEEEFNFLINKKDQMNIETKIRNIRFIGELCKFKIAPAGLVFSCLKACLDDFSHHNIDVACNALETCGRFLYRSPETSIRMANMLEILMRLKNVKNLDPRHSTLVENAYYLCKPPERSARVAKVRPPLHQYIRKLLFSDLDKTTIELVLRQLRKLPWSECEAYLLKCFMKVHRGKYGQIHLIASLTAGLSRYHDEFAVAVVDEVLEEIRLGLELNDYGMQQRRIAYMRFVGELYNYELVDSSVIFETLDLILAFGHGTPEQVSLDPPEDCFRIRMVMTLLVTCGHYFGRGSSKRKLDRFLVHFQRYVLSKSPLPLDIEFDVQDLFADLRPNMTRYSSIEEVNAAILELEEHESSASSEKTNSEKHSETKKPSTASSNSDLVSVNGKSTVNGGNDENGIGESDSDSDNGTVDQEGEGREEELDEENRDGECDSEDEEENDGRGAASDEDDEVHVRQKVTKVDPFEEASFDQELRALMQESMEQRKQEVRGRPVINMAAVPIGEEVAAEEDEREGEVKVKVLVKRGNKQQTRQMLIPRDCSLVQTAKLKEAAELEEKQDIKRLVLEYNDREEEELAAAAAAAAAAARYPPGRGGTRARHYTQSYSGAGIYYNRRR